MLTTGTRTTAAGRAGRQLPDGGRGWESDGNDLEEVLTFPVFSGREEEKQPGGQGSSQKPSCPERGSFPLLVVADPAPPDPGRQWESPVCVRLG